MCHYQFQVIKALLLPSFENDTIDEKSSKSLTTLSLILDDYVKAVHTSDQMKKVWLP